MRRLTDPSFRYVPSHMTDIRRTFERARAEQQATKLLKAAKQRHGDGAVASLKVSKIGG